MDIFSKVWLYQKDWTSSFKNETQHHSNNCHGCPYSTPFDQPNFSAPIDIRISADYSIFENGAQKMDCYVGCVASGFVLFKPTVVHVIFFNFWKQKFIEGGTVTLAIDGNGGSLLFFEKKWPNDATVPKSASVTRCGCISFSMMTLVFSEPQMRQFY